MIDSLRRHVTWFMMTETSPPIRPNPAQTGDCRLSTAAAFLLAACLGSPSCAAEPAAKSPNVLFVMVDDLAPCLAVAGHPHSITPNMDRLAETGVRFSRAYCQLPLCNPSRASIMTGLRPDQIRVYDLDRHFRAERPNTVTLPQLLRRKGYSVSRIGKIYHYNVPAGIGTNGLDDPLSWDSVINPRGRDVTDEHLITNPTPERPVSAAMSWLQADGEDGEQTDGQTALEAVRWMTEHISARPKTPFFLAVGFFRPHTPYVAPKRWFDIHPVEKFALPFAPADDRTDVPVVAFAHNNPTPNYGLDDATLLKALQAYHASVSFVDAQVGRLLESLEALELADNTIVVLISDHGYHLGEHRGVWQKRTLFEESAKAPLIIRAPDGVLQQQPSRVSRDETSAGVRTIRVTEGSRSSGNGTPCARIVEFIDVYPTIAELCGCSSPPELTGHSLVPLLRNPSKRWEEVAVTQILRRTTEDEPVMGRSVRTPRWRYTEWDGGDRGTELYDHQQDPGEFRNLAGDRQYQAVIRNLQRLLNDRAEAQVPPTPFNIPRL